MYKIREATKKGYAECIEGGVADLTYPDSNTRRGRVQGNGNICPALTAERIGAYRLKEYRIRKLTPEECWRIMNLDGYEKAADQNSATQLFKQAGNSIVCNCLVGIFGQMLKGKEDVYKDI